MLVSITQGKHSSGRFVEYCFHPSYHPDYLTMKTTKASDHTLKKKHELTH